MISDFSILKGVSPASSFQSLILKNIIGFLSKIDVSVLSETSFIELLDSKMITVSLVHKDDADTIVTLNVFSEHATLWYTSCDIYFDDYSGDFKINEFKKIYKNCLSGKYETIEFYLKNKLIYSSTSLLDYEKTCIVPNVLFSKFYKKMFKGKFIEKRVRFKSFIR